MKAIYLDCFSGISGNMLLGAFLDAGMPEDILRSELKKLPVHGYELCIERVVKRGISAAYVDVRLEHHHEDEHGHDHDHHHHRHLPDIIEIIDESSLSQIVKENSKKIFLHLAKAEAKVHGTTIDDIHFHEVGAVDAIVDIVGTVVCFDYLGIEAIYTSKLHTGCGFVKCSHGLMPVPAPATAELLKDIPYYTGKIERELVTPTGAAILAVLAHQHGDIPQNFTSSRIGYGAGTWDLEIPNVLRLHLGEVASEDNDDEVLVIEANIDDLNPQIYSHVIDKLLSIGALDVWLTPIIMKKSRPATLLSVLIYADNLNSVSEALFAETSTIGIRYHNVKRIVAQREIIAITSPWGEVRAKVSKYNGKVCSISPEYEDCRVIAEKNNVPLKLVQQTVIALASSSSK